MPQILTAAMLASPFAGELLDVLFGGGNENYQGAIASSGTVTTQATPTDELPAYYGTVILAPAGNITGVIVQPGLFERQELIILNNSAFTINFAAVGTSNVLGGVTPTILANSRMGLRWFVNANINGGVGFWC